MAKVMMLSALAVGGAQCLGACTNAYDPGKPVGGRRERDADRRAGRVRRRG